MRYSRDIDGGLPGEGGAGRPGRAACARAHLHARGAGGGRPRGHGTRRRRVWLDGRVWKELAAARGGEGVGSRDLRRRRRRNRAMRWERDMFIIDWGVWGGLGLGFSQYVNRCRVSLCLAVCGAGALRCCVACAGVACTLTPPSIERYGRPWPWPMLVSCVCVARQRRNFFRCVDHEGGQYSARTLISYVRREVVRSAEKLRGRRAGSARLVARPAAATARASDRASARGTAASPVTRCGNSNR